MPIFTLNFTEAIEVNTTSSYQTTQLAYFATADGATCVLYLNGASGGGAVPNGVSITSNSPTTITVGTVGTSGTSVSQTASITINDTENVLSGMGVIVSYWSESDMVYGGRARATFTGTAPVSTTTTTLAPTTTTTTTTTAAPTTTTTSTTTVAPTTSSSTTTTPAPTTSTTTTTPAPELYSYPTWQPCLLFSLGEVYTPASTAVSRYLYLSVIQPDGFPWERSQTPSGDSGPPTQIVVSSAKSTFTDHTNSAAVTLGNSIVIPFGTSTTILSDSSVVTLGYQPISGDVLTAVLYVGDSRFNAKVIVV